MNDDPENKTRDGQAGLGLVSPRAGFAPAELPKKALTTRSPAAGFSSGRECCDAKDRRRKKPEACSGCARGKGRIVWILRKMGLENKGQGCDANEDSNRFVVFFHRD